jgi:D-beta-D-heptose 7-phosphate kinase/D-beta-D-heptose 1-phosphate adenosyltransferase
VKDAFHSRPSLPVERVRRYVERFASARVAVLGDLMLDRYFWGEVERISPEAPVPVVRVNRRSRRLGGAANVAANLRALGAAAEVVGVRGDDREGREVVRMLERRGISATALAAERGRETTEKVRIIARHQQVVRADFESDDPIGGDTRARIYERALALAESFDALVVSDYGKGVILESDLRGVVAAWRGRGKPVLVDPHVPHFAWYRGATVVTPNAREALLSTGIDFRKGQDPSAAAFEVVRRMELGALLVTRGEDGMSLYYYSGGAGAPPADSGRAVHIPTVAKEVFDVTGAGDTVISVLSLALATGVDLVDGVVLANQAAGEVIKEVGTSTLTAAELIGAFA